MGNESKVMGIDVDSIYLECWAGSDANRLNGVKNRFKNIKNEFPALLKWLLSENVSHVVMEATGGYETKVSSYLSERGVKVYVINPLQARNFAKGIGLRAKNDRIDAYTLGRLGQVANLTTSFSHSEAITKLKQLVIRRDQLVRTKTEEKTRLGLAEEEIKKSIQNHITFIESEVESIEKKMNQLIGESQHMLAKQKVLCSQKGIGLVSSTVLLALLPELGYLNHKEIASLVGLAPFDNDSGLKKGIRSIWGGRFYVRKALYMPAWVAVQSDPFFQTFYHRLVEKGKPKKVAIVAVMRKILVRLNAMTKNFIELHVQKN